MFTLINFVSICQVDIEIASKQEEIRIQIKINNSNCVTQMAQETSRHLTVYEIDSIIKDNKSSKNRSGSGWKLPTTSAGKKQGCKILPPTPTQKCTPARHLLLVLICKHPLFNGFININISTNISVFLSI